MFILFQLPAVDRDIFQWTRLLQGPSNPALNTLRDGRWDICRDVLNSWPVLQDEKGRAKCLLSFLNSHSDLPISRCSCPFPCLFQSILMRQKYIKKYLHKGRQTNRKCRRKAEPRKLQENISLTTS